MRTIECKKCGCEIEYTRGELDRVMTIPAPTLYNVYIDTWTPVKDGKVIDNISAMIQRVDPYLLKDKLQESKSDLIHKKHFSDILLTTIEAAKNYCNLWMERLFDELSEEDCKIGRYYIPQGKDLYPILDDIQLSNPTWFIEWKAPGFESCSNARWEISIKAYNVVSHWPYVSTDSAKTYNKGLEVAEPEEGEQLPWHWPYDKSDFVDIHHLPTLVRRKVIPSLSV